MFFVYVDIYKNALDVVERLLDAKRLFLVAVVVVAVAAVVVVVVVVVVVLSSKERQSRADWR